MRTPKRPLISSFISLRIINRLPRLVIHEKYENSVKGILRVLTILGIVTSIISIPLWYISLLIALVFFIVEQFFEKAIFQFTSIYVQPLPQFEYDTSEWKGMVFAFPLLPNSVDLISVGCAFKTKEYAESFFKYLKQWNYNQNEDKDNNICLSFIIEDDENYSTYIYPNPFRDIVSKTFKKIADSLKFEKYGKEQQQLVAQFLFCKLFPYGENSQLNNFIKKQDQKKPFILRPFIMHNNGQFEFLSDELSILKFHFKFKERSALEKNELEYGHGKKVMNK